MSQIKKGAERDSWGEKASMADWSPSAGHPAPLACLLLSWATYGTTPTAQLQDDKKPARISQAPDIK